MKRELKFRVFDTEYNKYHWDQGDWSLGIKSGMVRGIYGEEFPEFIVEQYTGLKDRHGKEIYEGDLIKYSPWNTEDGLAPYSKSNSFKEGDVYFSDGRFVVRGNETWDTLTYKHIEIIGNIHQTP